MSIMVKSPDPTKDPEFQRVVQTFLRTPPKPHKSKAKKGKPNVDRKRMRRPKAADKDR
jgi:hypothetical protein